MNIAIVRAFIALRKFALQHSEVFDQLKELTDRIAAMPHNSNRYMMPLKTCSIRKLKLKNGKKGKG